MLSSLCCVLESIMDNTKNTVSEIKERVQSFVRYISCLEGQSGTIRKTVMMKNVMSMSQIETRIEYLIGKKENPIKM